MRDLKEPYIVGPAVCLHGYSTFKTELFFSIWHIFGYNVPNKSNTSFLK